MNSLFRTWGWRAFWVVCGLWFVWAIWPFLHPKSRPQPTHTQTYASMELCQAEHGSTFCQKAIEQLHQWTIQQLPMYAHLDACQGFWKYCQQVDTGPASSLQAQSPHVIVAVPTVRGFQVTWSGDLPEHTEPLFEAWDGQLHTKQDDPRLSLTP